MNIEQAVEKLKSMRLYMEINDRESEHKFSDEDYKANEMAIKALENQIKKKPIKREIGSEKLKRIIYHCPNCNKRLYDCAFKHGELDHVSPGSRKSKRCEKCDCRLDWSDFNG